MLTEDNVKEEFLESDQYLPLLGALPSYLRSVLTFGYRTGWRVNGIRNRTWDRVDLKERTVALSANMTKNRKARAIYLDDDLLNTLQLQNLKRAKDCDYVFHRDGNQIKDFRESWNKACRKAGLGYGYNLNKKYFTEWEKKELKEGPTFHDLRRSAARNLIRSGVGRDVAKCITGHKTDSVFSRYNITNQDDMRKAALKQQAYLSGQEN